MPGQQVVKTGFHDVVGHTFHAKVRAQRGAGPGDGAGLGQHRVLEGGEVADTHKFHAFFHRIGHGFVRQLGQQACEAIPPARDQRHMGTTGGRAANGGDAGGVVPGKPQMAGQCGFVHLHLVP